MQLRTTNKLARIDSAAMEAFKFTQLRYIQSAIEYGAFASPISVLNDPYEWQGRANHFWFAFGEKRRLPSFPRDYQAAKPLQELRRSDRSLQMSNEEWFLSAYLRQAIQLSE